MTLRNELIAALAAHDRRANQPWSGPYHFRLENDGIGAIRVRAFALLGLDIQTVSMSNEALLKALSDVS